MKRLHEESKRSMVGGYSTLTVDSQQLQELLPIARYALHEFVARQRQQHEEEEAEVIDTAAASSSLVILPPQLFQADEEEIIESFTPLIVSAQRQVVAGMNYKLTIAILHKNVCLGGFQVTVWRQLSKELRVTNWGRVMNGDEMEVEFGEELVDALRVVEGGGEIESEPEE
jgi:hypothetical protein